MITARKVIQVLQDHGLLWWDDIDQDDQQRIVHAVITEIATEANAELSYLRWFHRNADFGPASADVMAMLQAQYAATIAPVPAGYSWADEDEDE